jgi:2-oxoglutarate dehydrogenase E2 component (dihydrolipoamide succinyltransferase)
MTEVRLPQLGESVAEGTVTTWLVKVGDAVKLDQPLCVVATDKADTEVRAPSAGVVTELLAAEGSVLPTGSPLCRLDPSAAAAPAVSAAAAPPATPAPAEASEHPKAPLASPSTRKLAREEAVDLTAVKPTGDHGRITHDDVRRAAETRHAPPSAASTPTSAPPPPAPPVPAVAAARAAAPAPRATADTAELAQLLEGAGGFVPPVPGVGFGSYKVPPYTPKPGDKVVPFSRRRRITADHMVYSKVTSPHVVTVAEVDLFATSKLRDAHKDRFKKEGVSLTFLSFICAATVKALRENPEFNARVLDNAYVVLRHINLGVAVDTPGGLVVPSIKNADELTVRGIARAIDELAVRARAGKITADDLAGTTFSVSNPGLKGNLFGGAIIAQPNVGILRMGEIKKRPVVVTTNDEDHIAIHPVMFLALSYDHRIVDGVLANSFLWRVADILGRAEFDL